MLLCMIFFNIMPNRQILANSSCKRLTSCRTWLWKTARGISGEEVEDRLLPKSHGCGKTFPGPRALKNSASVRILALSFSLFFNKIFSY
jgi:nucleotidyltransferase/DNA polymerase involved in DNA repair